MRHRSVEAMIDLECDLIDQKLQGFWIDPQLTELRSVIDAI